LPFNKFFPVVDEYLSSEDIARHSCVMVPIDGEFLAILGPVFPASHAQQVSGLHSKFALGPYPCGSMADIHSATYEIRRGKKKKERRKKKKPQDKNITDCPITYGGHNNGLPYSIERP